MIKTNKIYNEDCLETMAKMPDNFVDCIITSPPYYQLRKYAGIPDYVWGRKNCEHEFNISYKENLSGGFSNIGSYKNEIHYESTSQTCTKCGAWKGQLGLEPTYEMFLDHLILIIAECKRVLKDTGTMFINLGDSYNSSPIGKQVDPKRKVQGGGFSYEHKKNVDKTIPNKCLMLIPHRFAIKCVDELGLILRNDIIWAKRNGMPESVKDRFSKKHEFIFFFTKQQKYYFDLDGVRDNATSTNKTYKAINTTQNKYAITNGLNRGGINVNGKNPGDVSDFWDIPTRPSSEKHYATFNTKLIDKPIIAGCPEGGIILDPFCGSGTTLVRGLQLKREVIGIDGSKEYCEIAQRKIAQELQQLKLAI